MAIEVMVDGTGRMVIPIRLRRSMGLDERGGVVMLEEGPDGLTLTTPSDGRAEPSVDEHGLLVLDVGRTVDLDDVAAAVATDRDRRG